MSTIVTFDQYAERTGRMALLSKSRGPRGAPIGHLVRLSDMRTVCGRMDVITSLAVDTVNMNHPPRDCIVCTDIASGAWKKHAAIARAGKIAL